MGVALLGTALDLARVGSVGASILLDGARALDGGTGVEEGAAVDLKGTLRGRGDDRRSRAAEGAGEALDVDGTGRGRGSVVVSVVVASVVIDNDFAGC